jgi:hypothetical protein
MPPKSISYRHSPALFRKLTHDPCRFFDGNLERMKKAGSAFSCLKKLALN